MFECPQEGKIHRFPLTSDKTVNRQEVHVAEIAVAKERMTRQNFYKLKHQKHAHKPRMPIGMCEVCDETRVLHNQEKQPEIGEKQGAVKAQADLIELKEKDINGFLYILTVTTDKGIKAAGGSKTKTAK